MDTFTPGLMPAILLPAYETATNKKLFSGAPITPERLKNLPSHEQFQPYTTEVSKQLGKFISHVPYIGDTKVASPIEIEHWVDAWSGSLGTHILKYSDKALEKTGIIPEKVDVEKELGEYPIAKIFVGRNGYSKQAASISKFYDEYKKLEKLNNSVKLAVKEGRQHDLPDKEAIVARFKHAQQIAKAFGKINATIRNIQLDHDNYTSAGKKILIDQLVADQVGVAREFLGKE